MRWLVAILLGSFAGLIAVMQLIQKESEVKQGQNPVEVYRAKAIIKPGITITAEMVEKAPIPNAFVQPGALQTPDKVIGQVTLLEIAPKEQIVASKLAPSLMRPLAEVVPHGMRGVTLETGRGLAGLVQVGDRVDLLGIYQFQRSGSSLLSSVRMLFQNVQVIAVGQFTVPNVLGRTKKLFEAVGESGPGTGGTLTLAMTPPDAQRLILAQDLGRITIIMRGNDESPQPLQFEAVTGDDLLGSQYPVWTPATKEFNLMSRTAREQH